MKIDNVFGWITILVVGILFFSSMKLIGTMPSFSIYTWTDPIVVLLWSGGLALFGYFAGRHDGD